MRSILVDWIIQVHQKFKLLHETLYLSILILDRYLSKTDIKRGKSSLSPRLILGLVRWVITSEWSGFENHLEIRHH